MFDKIAHKIDRMGDFKPEIVYESAAIREVDPRDDSAVAKINLEDTPQLVTVRDDIDLPVIAAFRLLAAKLQARHPILLKDTLNCRASVSDANGKDGVSQSGAAGTRATQTGSPKGEARGSERIKRPTICFRPRIDASYHSSYATGKRPASSAPKAFGAVPRKFRKVRRARRGGVGLAKRQ